MNFDACDIRIHNHSYTETHIQYFVIFSSQHMERFRSIMQWLYLRYVYRRSSRSNATSCLSSAGFCFRSVKWVTFPYTWVSVTSEETVSEPIFLHMLWCKCMDTFRQLEMVVYLLYFLHLHLLYVRIIKSVCFGNWTSGPRGRRFPAPSKNPFTWLFFFVSCPNHTYEVKTAATSCENRKGCVKPVYFNSWTLL